MVLLVKDGVIHFKDSQGIGVKFTSEILALMGALLLRIHALNPGV